MPTDLSGQLGGVFDAFFGSEIVQFLMYSIVLYLFILWLAATYWAFRDMHERTENPALPYVAAGIILIATPFLFILGVIVYRVVRPAERLGEVYERNLAEEALLAEVEAVKTCRGCDKRVDEAWIICPWCRTRLNRICPNCERLVGLDWTLCAWCGKDFERLGSAERVAADPIFGSAPNSTVGQDLPPRPASGTITNRKPAVGG
jgi:hypothetical protein